MRHVERKEIRFLLNAANDDYRLTKIGLRMTCRMGQGHEHLAAPPLLFPNVILDDHVAAGEAMFIPQPLKYLLGCVALLAVPA